MLWTNGAAYAVATMGAKIGGTQHVNAFMMRCEQIARERYTMPGYREQQMHVVNNDDVADAYRAWEMEGVIAAVRAA